MVLEVMDNKGIVKSFRLFAKAFSLTKYQMGISLLVLIPITFLLTTILYLAENPVQPEQYTFWNALAWSSTGHEDRGAVPRCPVSNCCGECQ